MRSGSQPQRLKPDSSKAAEVVEKEEGEDSSPSRLNPPNVPQPKIVSLTLPASSFLALHPLLPAIFLAGFF